MSKYIDADALLEDALKIGYWDNRDEAVLYDLIDSQPAADVEPVRKWISVDERLPEHEGSYLVCTAKSGAFISHYYPQYKHFNGANGHITHWMNRPEPPKMDGGSK